MTTMHAQDAPSTRTDSLPPLTTRAGESASWPHDPSLTFVNHGSYGLCPLVVADAQTELRRRIDLDPVRFFKVDLERYADQTRRALSAFVGAAPEHLALVPNATFAVATVLNAAELEPGDEVLITDHEYQATRNELARIATRTGARIVEVHVPFPNITPDAVVEAVESGLTERTKLVVVSHIASASAAIFPVEQIVRVVRSRGIDILIDGAHSPGQIPLDLDDLGATFYTGSCHKWLCTPKGTGFFHAEPSAHSRIKPLALSCRVHETRADRSAFLCDFDYVGTNDYTPNLVIPVAIDHLGAQLPGGWDELMGRNHDLVVAGAQLVCDAIGVDQPVPESMIGSMVGIALPDAPAGSEGRIYEDPLWDRLMEVHGIQVPIWPLEGVANRIMRLSAQLYNTLDDYRTLADALVVELEAERA